MIQVAEPQGAYHACAVSAADYALRAALPPGFIVRLHAPVALDDGPAHEAPEPDLTIVPGRPGDYRAAHPARPALALEIAEAASLEVDREEKGSLYARAGIEDYWIVNLADRALEVYRDPAPDPSGVHGWRYRTVALLRPPALVIPLAFDSARIPVADLLP